MPFGSGCFLISHSSQTYASILQIKHTQQGNDITLSQHRHFGDVAVVDIWLFVWLLKNEPLFSTDLMLFFKEYRNFSLMRIIIERALGMIHRKRPSRTISSNFSRTWDGSCTNPRHLQLAAIQLVHRSVVSVKESFIQVRQASLLPRIRPSHESQP